MKSLFKVINKKSQESLTDEEIKTKTEEFNQVISRGLKKYKEDKENGSKIKQLETNMFFNK